VLLGPYWWAFSILGGDAESAATEQHAWNLGDHQQKQAARERDENIRLLTGKKALVVSIAHGPKYSPKELTPFVESARKALSTYYADIVFLVDEAKTGDATWISFCEKYAIQYEAMKANDTTIETARIAFIVDYLKKHHHKYEWICVTDSRDVLLQSNPFPSLGSKQGVHLYGEQIGRGNFGYAGMASEGRNSTSRNTTKKPVSQMWHSPQTPLNVCVMCFDLPRCPASEQKMDC
jgi:hypothetical protein